MRGKVLKKNGCEREIRITPAYAGKSVQLVVNANDMVGSPPPMRGKECDESLL